MLYRRLITILKRATRLKKKPVPVANLLTLKNRQISSVITGANRLIQIKIIASQALDEQVADHLAVAKMENGVLTLIADSPVWATRIRYMQNEIINRLKNYAITKSIFKISVKVRPFSHSYQQKKRQQNQLYLSQSSADKMLETIKTISDPELKSALLRITKHVK